ncbi:uncharacterized protein LOC134533465 [Bacillus rossius redtenbacheri]|uniref:uncharacterized protein LOC134533465 n=1 Tax=Bacillus rossius redtenbacheri TaxID=93214 RepID=UPI002FDDCF8A
MPQSAPSTKKAARAEDERAVVPYNGPPPPRPVYDGGGDAPTGLSSPWHACPRSPVSDAAHITSMPPPHTTAGGTQLSPYPLGADRGCSPHPFAACHMSPVKRRHPPDVDAAPACCCGGHPAAVTPTRHGSPASEAAYLASAPPPHFAAGPTQLPSHPPGADGGSPPHPFAACPMLPASQLPSHPSGVCGGGPPHLFAAFLRSPASDAAHLAMAPPPHATAGATQGCRPRLNRVGPEAVVLIHIPVELNG